MTKIYKIVTKAQWKEAEERGQFEGAPVDLADGYVHFSTAHQVMETAAKHFGGVHDLLLVEIDGDKLGDSLVYEPSRGGDLFPHLYANLPMQAVVSVMDLPLGPDGRHQFPDMITKQTAS